MMKFIESPVMVTDLNAISKLTVNHSGYTIVASSYNRDFVFLEFNPSSMKINDVSSEGEYMTWYFSPDHVVEVDIWLLRHLDGSAGILPLAPGATGTWQFALSIAASSGWTPVGYTRVSCNKPSEPIYAKLGFALFAYLGGHAHQREMYVFMDGGEMKLCRSITATGIDATHSLDPHAFPMVGAPLEPVFDAESLEAFVRQAVTTTVASDILADDSFITETERIAVNAGIEGGKVALNELAEIYSTI